MIRFQSIEISPLPQKERFFTVALPWKVAMYSYFLGSTGICIIKIDEIIVEIIA
jgi:hypothetical protein